MRKFFIVPAFLLLIGHLASANVRLPNIFGDNMVLQRGKPVKIWGWAAPGEKIRVQLGGQVSSTRAKADSSWELALEPMEAGGPHTLAVQGKNRIVINNILIGELWVSSGQSNMDWPVRLSANALEEISKANYPMIRHLKVPWVISGTPQSDMPPAAWQIADSSHVGDFSAVSYFFAQKLYDELHVPIGIVNSSWGGTIAETWISRPALEQSPEFDGLFDGSTYADIESKNEQQYNAIVAELKANLGKDSEVARWKEWEWDDSQWKTLPVPLNFDQAGLAKFDGRLWVRKTINLTKDDIQQNAILHLGTIDDRDETFVNGQPVGSNDGYNVMRTYTVPKHILKEGKNVIAVRVEDNQGNGGLFSAPSILQLICGTKIIPLSGQWPYRIESIQKSGVNPNSYPSLLFNAMIHPLLHLNLSGIIWYQGESNADHAYQYRTTFPLLINDWRKNFQQPELPFYYVQLAGFNAANGNSRQGSQWAELREAQTMALALPNTGMAVTFDIGESNDIHPRDKQTVGFRLAAIALHKLYGRNMAFSGPQYESMAVSGREARLEFAYANTGLKGKDKWGYIRGFEMAGADRKFYYAQARAEGNKLVVTCDSVAVPVAVRYGWADDMPEANLYNAEGFPAIPFRTDNWEMLTREGKYKL